MNYHKLQQVTFSFGFTLLELLIVMLLISLLAGIGGLTYTNTQKSGRDSKRLADLKRLQSALDLYYADNHTYPELSSDCSSGDWKDASDLGVFLITSEIKYTEYIPTDPGPETTPYKYCASGCSDGKCLCYCLSAQMEKAENEAVEGECGTTYDSGHENGYYLTCP